MKYKLLTDETKVHEGVTLYRIQSLKDFSDVKSGDKGGWIEKESNLSHEGDACIYDNAKVYDKAKVYGNACIYDNAKVYNDARVYGTAEVHGNSEVSRNTEIY